MSGTALSESMIFRFPQVSPAPIRISVPNVRRRTPSRHVALYGVRVRAIPHELPSNATASFLTFVHQGIVG